jgi:hypothetical protein
VSRRVDSFPQTEKTLEGMKILEQTDDDLHARHIETRKRLDQLDRNLANMDTTIAQVRRMAAKDVHPTWMHAAYADLAGRLARVEALNEELGASMSLLHSKMEMIIGQLAAYERQDRAEGDPGSH